MNRIDLESAQWCKSSYSNGNGNCVEVAQCGAYVAMRDSKQQSGPVLTSTAEGWRAFIAGVVTHQIDGM